MHARSAVGAVRAAIDRRDALGGDFRRFWLGQSVSALGSSFTLFALPLLVFRLTGSAMGLAAALAAGFLPYPLLGLVIGAWSDRVDRKRLMIRADVARALVIATVPLLSAAGMLSVWWIYAVAFAQTTLGILFDAGRSAAVQRLVARDQLVVANGRLQAAFAAMQLAGPPLAGAAVFVLPLASVLLGDAASFLVSALSLTLVRADFGGREGRREKRRLRTEIGEGLRCVLANPRIRNVSLMLAVATFLYAPASAELVLFAKQRLHAGDSELGLLFGAGSLGSLVFALLAPLLARRLGFAARTFGVAALKGVLLMTFAVVGQFWLGAATWLLVLGFGTLFGVSSEAQLQELVPNELMGRVRSTVTALSWSLIPVGTLLGGLLVETTGSVPLLYASAGAGIAAVATLFLVLSAERAPLPTPQARLRRRAAAVATQPGPDTTIGIEAPESGTVAG
ncbi:MAG: MFS transporter [Gaiellaceae bacterium]